MTSDRIQWWDGLDPIECQVECGSGMHSIEWRAGEFILRDHDILAEETLSALARQPGLPECVEIVLAWRACAKSWPLLRWFDMGPSRTAAEREGHRVRSLPAPAVPSSSAPASVRGYIESERAIGEAAWHVPGMLLMPWELRFLLGVALSRREIMWSDQSATDRWGLRTFRTVVSQGAVARLIKSLAEDAGNEELRHFGRSSGEVDEDRQRVTRPDEALPPATTDLAYELVNVSRSAPGGQRERFGEVLVAHPPTEPDTEAEMRYVDDRVTGALTLHPEWGQHVMTRACHPGRFVFEIRGESADRLTLAVRAGRWEPESNGWTLRKRDAAMTFSPADGWSVQWN